MRTTRRRAEFAVRLPLRSRSRQTRHDCSLSDATQRIRNRRLRSARLNEDCFPAPKQARAINAIPSPTNRPNLPPTQRSRPTRESDFELIIHDARQPTHANPSATAKTPRNFPPFLKPFTCPSRRKVARNLIPTPFTAHCHPAYQVSMIPEDTPPLTKLCVSSLTYPSLVRHSPADHPPHFRRPTRTPRCGGLRHSWDTSPLAATKQKTTDGQKAN